MQEGQHHAADKFAVQPQAGNQISQAASAASTNSLGYTCCVAVSTHSLAISTNILAVAHQIPNAVICSHKRCGLLCCTSHEHPHRRSVTQQLRAQQISTVAQWSVQADLSKVTEW